MNFNITRRQFLQYCTASAAALGLSQTDLLKLERALAAPQKACTYPSPSVIWLTGQACSGCPVSLLNRVVQVTGGYYDADLINALYPSLPVPQGTAADPVGLELNVVNDAADLLVGDAVRALVPGLTRGLNWSDDLSGLLTGSLLDAYIGPFPGGFITLEWNTTVMAAAGDLPAGHLRDVVNGSGLLGKFVLVVDGSIPSDSGNYCLVFDNEDENGNKVISSEPLGASITVNQALRWMYESGNCLAVVSQGTCSSFGGIPGGQGNKTGAMGVKEWLEWIGKSPGIDGPAVVNVPGCPPHPDWTVYTVAYILAHSTASPLSLALPTLDMHGRPVAVFSGSDGTGTTPFCYDCPNQDTQGTPQAAQELGEAGCLGGLGCKGPYTVGDCPIRQKNTADDGTLMNWCVGAQGQNSTGSGALAAGIGEARHPCQGCIMPDFPDWSGLTVSGDKTSKRIKGFYNE